jgi:hypothetical protein
MPTEAVAMPAQPALRNVIVAATVGNVLEWFDFLVYGYFAVVIAEVFFPKAPVWPRFAAVRDRESIGALPPLAAVGHARACTRATARQMADVLTSERRR